jgi:hypothetical protein
MRCPNCGAKTLQIRLFASNAGKVLNCFVLRTKHPSARAHGSAGSAEQPNAAAIQSEAITAKLSSGSEMRLLAGQTATSVTDGERKTH